jgi:hypothetical protein
VFPSALRVGVLFRHFLAQDLDQLFFSVACFVLSLLFRIFQQARYPMATCIPTRYLASYVDECGLVTKRINQTILTSTKKPLPASIGSRMTTTVFSGAAVCMHNRRTSRFEKAHDVDVRCRSP